MSKSDAIEEAEASISNIMSLIRRGSNPENMTKLQRELKGFNVMRIGREAYIHFFSKFVKEAMDYGNDDASIFIIGIFGHDIS